MALSQPQIVTHRTEDYPGLDQASGGELERLLRALNTNTQGAQQALTSLQANPLLAASYYRLNEGPYPTSSSAICLLLQYRTGNSWATVRAWGKDGRPIADTWTAATLINSWVNRGGAYPPAGYYRDAAGVVHLRGQITTGASGAVAFVLPSGYRPAYMTQVAILASGGVAWVSIDTSGNLTPSSLTGNVSTSACIDGITYRAEQ